MTKNVNSGREPWSSGYGKRLTFRRSWVQIPYSNSIITLQSKILFTSVYWIDIFHLFVVKIVMVFD